MAFPAWLVQGAWSSFVATWQSETVPKQEVEAARLLCLVPNVPVSVAAPSTRQPREAAWELMRGIGCHWKGRHHGDAVAIFQPPQHLAT